jgi:hypothetical protein
VRSPAHGLFKVPPEPLDATGYFWLVCMMNHSCAPNGSVVYDTPPGASPHLRHAPHEEIGGGCDVSPPATARIVARRAIRAGEEITHSYVDRRDQP